MKSEKIGTRIRRYRSARSLTQKQLADKAGLSRVSVGNYERGKRVPDQENLQKISVALDIPFYRLNGNEELNEEFQSFLFETLEKTGMDVQEFQDKIGIQAEEIKAVLLGNSPSLEFIDSFADFLTSIFPSIDERAEYKRYLVEKFKYQAGYTTKNSGKNQKLFQLKEAKEMNTIPEKDYQSAVYSYLQKKPVYIFLDENQEGHYIFVNERREYDEKAQKELRSIIEAFFRATNQ